MAKSSKDYVAEANAQVEKRDPSEARSRIERDGGILLDVRDPAELKDGKAKGAVNVPRGMLEFRADPDTNYHDPELKKDRPVYVYCASGGRAALAGKVLKEMGYRDVYNIGGFKDWVEAGGETEKPA